MKALFVGLGSICRRHVEDFYDECFARGVIPEIHVLRREITELGCLGKFVTKQITSVTDADYDVVFITNPTRLHFESIKELESKGRFFFIEKPIADSLSYCFNDLNIDEYNTYVAAPMRHTRIYKQLKKIVTSHSVFASRIICSSYLPEWRPNIDYRNVYSAKKGLGGGVSLDLIHEIDYALDLFGKPEEIFNIKGHVSNLEIDSDDISAYLFRFHTSVCEMHLDYFGRKYTRICEIFTEEGTYVTDFFHECITCPDGTVVNWHVKDNEEFKEEMEYFLDFVTGKTKVNINSPANAIFDLQVALGGARYER